ncbi:MAG: carnitine dehydratase [Microbacteriaceae bacterium]|nr:carnitine dehydratase [Microbacteriaceae bacterium]
MSGATPAELLDDILATVGEPAAGGAVTFNGVDPVLPTAFKMGELGAASIGAAALQVGRMHAERTGVEQDIEVDVEAAAVAMRSSRQLVVNPPLIAPALHTVGTYRTGDGRYLFTQRLFPHHFERQLEVLGCRADEAEIAAAIAKRSGAELEEAMVANGASAALVRTRGEWEQLPQSSAVASLPLMEITRIGDADPIPLPGGERPLSGLRVLDVTRVLAGPTAARTLAEQGADVLRISSALMPDDRRMMIDTGHGKRSTVLDLRTAPDLATLRGLVAGADVFSQGYRPGALAALGLSPEELAEMRPGIVALSFSAFGRLGPWSGRRGFDSIVQSVSGISLENGDGEKPRSLPANPLDYITGYLGAFGVLAALRRRAREGGSYHVQVSLAQAGHYLYGLPRTDRALADTRPAEPTPEQVQRLSLHRQSEFGELSYLAPVARFSKTPAEWALPSVPADHDAARWA